MPQLYRPGQAVDYYTITTFLGSGGASRVYAAQDQRTGQQVVLKFPSDDLLGGRAVYERYQREAEIGQLLDSPRLQRHVNGDETRGTDYLVLEYMQGKTLREAMAESAPACLSQPYVLALIIQVCEAVAYLHDHGVIHQDIKPDNIFLLDNGEIKLFDFGIALLVRKDQRRWRLFPQLVGTPDYMAPERLQGKTGTMRSDVYAVGIVLYELLCGRTPFQETDGFAFVSQHTSHDPPDILQFEPSLSPALAAVVMRAIRRDPDKRYATIQAMADDLEHLEEVTPMSYIPDPPLLGGSYRQVVRLSLVIVVILLLLISFGVLAQLAHHAIH